MHRGLIGSLDSGVPDLAQKNRASVLGVSLMLVLLAASRTVTRDRAGLDDRIA